MDWDKAYRDHHDQVFWTLYRRTDSNSVLAEDLTQDTFVKAMRGIHGFTDSGRGLGPWLTVIALNLLRDHWRRSTRQREVLADVFYDEWTPLVPPPETTVLTEFEATDAVAMVQRLNALQREAMLLTCDELPDAVIALRMGRNIGAVKTLKSRARAALRRELAEVA